MPDRLRLFAAVVVHGAIASQLDGLRMALGSTEVGRIPPHITLVPPVNVTADALPAVLAALRSVGRAAVPISTTIGPVAIFDREHPVVYAAVDDATGAVEQLASAVAVGHLAPAGRDDPYAFVPHVTLANRTDREVAGVAVTALAHLSLAYEIDAITLLRLDDLSGTRRWTEIADVTLGTPAVRGRGGIEIELWRTRMLDPEGTKLLAEPGAAVSGVGEPWAITGRVDGAVVSIARGRIGGGWCNVDDLVVADGFRDQGFGSRTLEFVEQLAATSGASVVAVRPRATRDAHFLFGRGYTSTGDSAPSLVVKDSGAPL